MDRDAKASFSSQIKTIENNFPANAFFRKISGDAAYSQTQTLLRELAQYTDWDSSWAPIALSGWYSSQEIRSKANKILGRVSASVKEDVVVQRAIEKTPTHPAIEAGKDCKSQAIQMFGPIMGLTPGADTFACNKGKIGITVALIVALAIAIVLLPYAQLASTALRGVRKS